MLYQHYLFVWYITFDAKIMRRQFQEMLIPMYSSKSKVTTEQCRLAFSVKIIATFGLHKERKTSVNKKILRYARHLYA